MSELLYFRDSLDDTTLPLHWPGQASYALLADGEFVPVPVPPGEERAKQRITLLVQGTTGQELENNYTALVNWVERARWRAMASMPPVYLVYVPEGESNGRQAVVYGGTVYRRDWDWPMRASPQKAFGAELELECGLAENIAWYTFSNMLENSEGQLYGAGNAPYGWSANNASLVVEEPGESDPLDLLGRQVFRADVSASTAWYIEQGMFTLQAGHYYYFGGIFERGSASYYVGLYDIDTSSYIDYFEVPTGSGWHTRYKRYYNEYAEGNIKFRVYGSQSGAYRFARLMLNETETYQGETEIFASSRNVAGYSSITWGTGKPGESMGDWQVDWLTVANVPGDAPPLLRVRITPGGSTDKVFCPVVYGMGHPYSGAYVTSVQLEGVTLGQGVTAVLDSLASPYSESTANAVSVPSSSSWLMAAAISFGYDFMRYFAGKYVRLVLVARSPGPSAASIFWGYHWSDNAGAPTQEFFASVPTEEYRYLSGPVIRWPGRYIPYDREYCGAKICVYIQGDALYLDRLILAPLDVAYYAEISLPSSPPYTQAELRDEGAFVLSLDEPPSYGRVLAEYGTLAPVGRLTPDCNYGNYRLVILPDTSKGRPGTGLHRVEVLVLPRWRSL